MTGSDMTGCTDPLYHGILLPSRLVFYAGSYAMGAFSVRWNGNALLVEETMGGNFNCTPRAVTPDPLRWESFWKEIEAIGVWTWDETYANPHGCCGVTRLAAGTRGRGPCGYLFGGRPVPWRGVNGADT
jgi:hypothetical protein